MSAETIREAVELKRLNKQKKSIAKAIELVGSQKELADLIGVSSVSVGNWYKGETRVSRRNAAIIERKTHGLVKSSDLIEIQDNYYLEEY